MDPKMSGGSTDLDFIIENIEEHSPDTSQKENSIVMNNQAVPIEVQKNTGAKKKFYYSESIVTNLSSKSFQPNMDHTFLDKKKGEYLPSNFQATVDMINQGLRVCVIMRGAPGSGKSWLANKIIDLTVKKSHRNYILSADDFFMDPDGCYRYDNTKISEAHEFNQNRFKKKVREGWSPLIVDNTNTRLWEMIFYIQNALENNYHVELLEPVTPWRASPGQLQQRNKHNVNSSQIKIKLDNYEKATLDQIIRNYNLKHLKGKAVLQRHFPVIFQTEETNPFKFNTAPNNVMDWNQGDWIQIESKSERGNKDTLLMSPTKAKTEIEFDAWNLEESIKNSNKVPNEPVFDGIWATPAESEDLNKKSRKQNEKSTTTLPLPQRNNNSNKKKDKKMIPHRKDCPMIDPNFSSLCEIYPQINDRYLWDLFVRVKGDMEWVTNILLDDTNSEQIDNIDPSNVLTCNCFTSNYVEPVPYDPPIYERMRDNTSAKPNQNQRNNKKHVNSMKSSTAATNDEVQNIKKGLEEKFQINPEAYPDHVLQVKMWKGIQQEPAETVAELIEIEYEQSFGSEARPLLEDDIETTDSEGPEYSPDQELIAMDFGKEFIKQLDTYFGGGCFQQEIDSSDTKIPTKVFMPRKLGQEMYAIWLEQYYSKQEEEKIEYYKVDEELARQIQERENNKAIDKKPEFEEMLDMKSTMENYRQKIVPGSGASKNGGDSHIAKERLIELFPEINEEFLMEIYLAHNSNFSETVKILKDSLPEVRISQIQSNTKQFIEKSYAEITQEPIKSVSPPIQKNEEMDRTYVMRKLGDVRDSLEFHKTQKKECIQKARDAIRDGKYSTANYYTNMSNLHKMKIEEYSLLAASCTQKIHESIQYNQNILDLHYFKIVEAVQVLDIFLDKHINRLRTKKVPYKEVFVITGRGLHSIGGVPSIKIKSQSRLRERGLRYVEENPGLLKVKIHNQSPLVCEINP